MATARLRRFAALAVLLGMLTAGGVGQAQSTGAQAAQTPQQADFSKAQFVTIGLSTANLENGIRLLTNQPDGLTQPSSDGGSRQSMPNQLGPARYFYLDVHDTYIYGGQNKVVLTVTYKDVGLMPVYLEYDAFDPVRPKAMVDELTRKRVLLASRTNSDGWSTARVTLEDARFLGGQPGGADLRIASDDDLVIRQVSVFRQAQVPVPVPIEIELDGKLVAFDPNDVQPYVDGRTNRTLVPFRAMFNALGISDEEIKWHNETRTVEARRGQTTIMLTIDSDIAVVDGVPQKLDQPAIIVANRTMVPLRFVSERFGLQVEPFFSNTQRLIRLTSPPQQQP